MAWGEDRSLRIATWNMDYWKRSPALREEAWAFLRDRIRPDVALVQEAVPAPDLDQVVFRTGGMWDERSSSPRDLGWGSAVVSFGPQIRAVEQATGPFRPEPIPLLRTFPGSVAIAEVVGENPLIVVSAYGVIDRGYADTTVHRILSDLTPLLDERRGRGVVLAGDLNITTQWSSKHKDSFRWRHDDLLRRDSNLFDRFSALGLHNVVTRALPTPLEGCDCTLGGACRHVQTQRHGPNRRREPNPLDGGSAFLPDPPGLHAAGLTSPAGVPPGTSSAPAPAGRATIRLALTHAPSAC